MASLASVPTPPPGDYYFVKAGNMMLEQGLIQCNGTVPTRTSTSTTAGPTNVGNATNFTADGTATTATTHPVDVKVVNSSTGVNAGNLSAEPLPAIPWVGVAALFMVVKSMFGF
jgi:hypothetical protein